MKKWWQSLDNGRRYGIFLFISTIVCLTIAYQNHPHNPKIYGPFMFIGIASFITVMTLMAKSVDDNGGFDDPSDPKDPPSGSGD